MLMRAPVYVFTGVAASLLPNFTLVGATSRHELALVLQRTYRILLAVGGVVVLGAAVVAPVVLGRLYGNGFTVTRLELVTLGLGIALYLASATFLQALLAIERATGAATLWLVGGGALVAAYALTNGAEVMRVSVAIVVGTAVSTLGQWALLKRLLFQKGR
jgi:hypothetical protein